MILNYEELYVVYRKYEISDLLHASNKPLRKIFLDYDLAIDEANRLNEIEAERLADADRDYYKYDVYDLSKSLSEFLDDVSASSYRYGEESGYTSGHSSGYEQGYNDGYESGYSDGKDSE